jgi:hypothetical protein
VPNHVTNEIVASPQVIDAISRFLTDEEKAERREQNAKTAANYKARMGKDWPYAQSDEEKLEERIVDFNMLIPMPESVLNSEVGSNGLEMMDPRGWYGWSVTYWGTKWNGYSASWEELGDGRVRLIFDTAWSHPEPVVTALSEKFPDEVLEVQWADEDLGYNLGSYKIQGGEVSDFNQPDGGSDEANEMAAQIKYGKSYAELRAEWDAEDA